MFLSFVIFRSKMQWRVPDHSQTFYTSNVTPSWWTKQSPPTIHHLESPDARCGSSRNKAKNVAMEDWFTISQFWNLDEKNPQKFTNQTGNGRLGTSNRSDLVTATSQIHCRRSSLASRSTRKCWDHLAVGGHLRKPVGVQEKNTYVIYCACLKRFCLHTSFNQTVAHVPETPTHWQHLVQVQDGKKWTQLWTKICEIKTLGV